MPPGHAEIDPIDELLATLDRPKRRKDLVAAIDELSACWKAHYDALLAMLRSPSWDRERRLDERYRFAEPKELVWQAMLQTPTKRIVQDLAFLAEHDDDYVRRIFARDVGRIPKPFALDVVEILIDDIDDEVRDYACIGLRDCAWRGGFSKAYAKRAAELLLEETDDWRPDTSYGPTLQALEVFAPKTCEALRKRLREGDPLSNFYGKLYGFIEDLQSYDEERSAFAEQPAIYRYVYAIDWMDSEIRNGGVDQLYRNSTWPWILDAIEGAEVLGLDALAKALRMTVAYYHAKGRSKLKRRADAAFFASLPKPPKGGLDALEDRYYSALDKHGIDEFKEYWTAQLASKSSLFAEL